MWRIKKIKLLKGWFAPSSNKRKKLVEESRVLKEFIDYFNLVDDLRPDEAKQNLESAIVEILYKNEHLGCGLLISTDGFFLTCYHEVNDKKLKPLHIRGVDNKLYEIKRVCAINKQHDLALVKVDIPLAPKIIKFNFCSTEEFKGINLEPIALLTRWQGELTTENGTMEEMKNSRIFKTREATTWKKGPDINSSKMIHSNIVSQPGDSGGTLVLWPNFKIIGCHSGTMRETEFGLLVTFSPFRISFVQRYTNKLNVTTYIQSNIFIELISNYLNGL